MPKISTNRESGRVDLIEYNNGTGINALEFFEPTFFNGLKLMQELQNSEIISLGNIEIVQEYGFNILEDITGVYPNNKNEAIFILKANGYYAYGGFIENKFHILEVYDNSTDRKYFNHVDIE